MPPNPRGFYKGSKFNLAVDHQSLEILFLIHMLFKFNLFYFTRKLTTRRTLLPNPKLVVKPLRSYATKPERVCEMSLRFQPPNIIPTHFHSFKTITNFHFTIIFPTIY